MKSVETNETYFKADTKENVNQKFSKHSQTALRGWTDKPSVSKSECSENRHHRLFLGSSVYMDTSIIHKFVSRLEIIIMSFEKY